MEHNKTHAYAAEIEHDLIFLCIGVTFIIDKECA